MLILLFSGEDAYKKIRAGATLVQLYTGFAYGGPALIPQIKVLLTLHILEFVVSAYCCFSSTVVTFSLEELEALF